MKKFIFYLLLFITITFGCLKCTIYVFDNFSIKPVCDSEHIITVIAVGGCHSDRYGYGSCGAMLDNGKYAELRAPVVGEKVYECKWSNTNSISYERAY